MIFSRFYARDMKSATTIRYPKIIQGGMGIAVSSWQLARQISLAGELGVVSGTAIDSVIARRLQDGDLSGDIRRALAHFPDKAIEREILKRYFIEGGRDETTPYIDLPKLTLKPTNMTTDILVAATFVEVWLAKEGHDGIIGINLLEKIQLAIPAQIFGAILAGVDYILMGAGIPAQIPKLIDELSQGNLVSMRVDIADTQDKYTITFDPHTFLGTTPPFVRPRFLAIVSSHALVAYLNRDNETKPDGYVIENHMAGGHNAPPRAKNSTNDRGESIYTELDTPNIEKIKAMGSPFWLAGGYGTPEKIEEAIKLGAQGVQVGSLFALAKESGFTDEIRTQLRRSLTLNTLQIMTDAAASPTGFPFKVAQLPHTLSGENLYAERSKICDLGYLRQPFKRPTGGIGYRCPGEPDASFEFKNGDLDASAGSKCLCNALMADIGLGQVRPDGRVELPLVTIGSDLDGPSRMANSHPFGWDALEAIKFLRQK